MHSPPFTPVSYLVRNKAHVVDWKNVGVMNHMEHFTKRLKTQQQQQQQQQQKHMSKCMKDPTVHVCVCVLFRWAVQTFSVVESKGKQQRLPRGRVYMSLRSPLCVTRNQDLFTCHMHHHNRDMAKKGTRKDGDKSKQKASELVSRLHPVPVAPS